MGEPDTAAPLLDARSVRARPATRARWAFAAGGAVVLAAAAGIAPRTEVSPPADAAQRAALAPPTLRAPSPASAPATARESRGDDASAESVAARPVAVPAPRAQRPGFAAVDPRNVEDLVAPDAPRPIEVPRCCLVGRVGAFGVREAPPPREGFLGVVRVGRDPGGLLEAKEDVEDPATTAVRGRVLDEAGRPVAGATVTLWSCFYVRQSFYDRRASRIGRARTDADGAFDVRPIAVDTVHFGAGGEVLLGVRHPAFAEVVAQAVRGVAPGRETDVGSFTLPAKGVTLHGTVRDLEGRPVAGAVVRVSGVFDPVSCDKTERMVVLEECPAATTDAEGRYAVAPFAAGVHELSVHVRLDCVLHERAPRAGDVEWSPRVRASNAVRGRVVDPAGEPVGAAVVFGGGNWTPSNADGTFWLDNVVPGPLRLEVWHHAWHVRLVEGVPTNGDDVTLALERPLSRVRLTVLDPDGKPASLVAVDWTWPPGGGPSPFTPGSRYWRGDEGVFSIVVPEGAAGAVVSDARGSSVALGIERLGDGAAETVALAPPIEGR